MKRSTFNLKSRLVIAVIGLSALFPASAATINVNPGDSIQAAVNAAVSGDTINIAAGVYEEQVVVVEKDLNLLGEPGAVLKAPAAMTGTLVPYGSTRLTVLGVVLSEVNVSGLGFDGNRSGVVNARLTGVYYRSSSGTLSDCSFHSFRGDTRTSLREAAYIAFNSVGPGPDVTHVEVLNNTFSDNEDTIVVVGDDTVAPEMLRQTFLIEGNDITGIGTGTTAFQFGIRVTVGASGEVRHNTISNCLSVGSNPILGPVSSAGVLVFNTGSVGIRPPVTAQPVLVEDNTLVNNLGGVDLFTADGSRAVNNHIEGGGTGIGLANEGGIALSGNNVGAINNRISGSNVGVNLLANPVLGTASNAKVIANRISASTTPINVQPGVTGTKQHANKISP